MELGEDLSQRSHIAVTLREEYSGGWDFDGISMDGALGEWSRGCIVILWSFGHYLDRTHR